MILIALLLAGALAVTTKTSVAARRAMPSSPSSSAAARPSPRHESPSPTPSPTASPSAVNTSPSASPPPARHDELSRLSAFGEPIYCGAGTKPLIALTFDDGPGVLTPTALRRLRRFHAKATFFLVGKLLEEPSLAAIAAQEAAAGMAFGDHTWDHVMMTNRSTDFYGEQVSRTADAVRRATGKRPRLFRPPYEAHDRRLDRWLRSQGMLEVLWSTDSRDSQGLTTQRVFRTASKGIRPGAIILLHDNRGTTETALAGILKQIKERGLKAVTVPQLLTRDPPTAKQLRNHTCE